MARFRLHLITSDGTRTSSVIDAVDRNGAVCKRPAGTHVVAVSQLTAGKSGGRLPSAFLLELTETLMLLTAAGLDTSEALEMATEIFEGHRFKNVVETLRHAVAGGESLSAALSAYGVPGIFAALVRIGEGIGGLAGVLPALCDYLKTRKAIAEKFFSAMIYPLFILAVLFIGAVLIITLVAPRVIASLETLSSNEAALSSTVARMELSLHIFGGIVVTVFAAPLLLLLGYRLLPRFRLAADSVALQLPGLGRFLITSDLMNLCFALEALTQAGVLLEQAVEEAASVATNRALQRDIRTAGRLLLHGASPSAAFAAGTHIPRRFIRWLSIGERTGSPTEVFTGLKNYYRNEYEKSLSRVTGLIEPALILFTGAVLFAAVVVFVLPLFSWYGEIL